MTIRYKTRNQDSIDREDWIESRVIEFTVL